MARAAALRDFASSKPDPACPSRGGLSHTIAPRGRPQIERLSKLVQAIDELAASPRVAAHADADELAAILDKGKATLNNAIDKLTPLVEAWEAEALDAARAVDTFSFRRADGIGRLGAVMGELRAKLGGDRKAAYAYTQPSRGGETGEDEESEADVEEG